MRTSILVISLFIFSFSWGQTRTWNDYYNKAKTKFNEYKFSSALSSINKAFLLLPDTTREFFEVNQDRNEYIIDSLYFMRAIIKTIIGDSSANSDFYKMRFFNECLYHYRDSSADTIFYNKANRGTYAIYNYSSWYIADPGIVRTLIDVGVYFEYEKKSFLKAKRCFQMVSILQPDSVFDSDYAFYKLGSIAVEFKKYKYGLQISQEFLHRFSNFSDSDLVNEAYQHILKCMLAIPKTDMIPILDIMIARSLDDRGNLYYHRAVEYHYSGNLSKGCEDFKTALNLGCKLKKKGKMKKIFCNSGK